MTSAAEASVAGVLRVPGLARLVGSQVLARLPQGMLGVALLMHVQQRTGSYAAAGVVTAVFSIGAAISGPVVGRSLVRLGVRRVLGATVAVDTAAMLAFAYGPHTLWSFIPMALVLGCCTPPTLPVARSLYPSIVPATMSAQAYSIDAVAQELIWVVGPVLVATIAPLAGTTTALTIAAGVGLVGGVLMLTAPSISRARFSPSGKRLGGVLLKWPVVIATMAAMLHNAAYGSVQTGIVALFDDAGPTAGVVLACFSAGSGLGGLLASHLPMRPSSMAVRQIPTVVGLALAPMLPYSWWVGGCVLLAGLGAAPAMAVMYNVVSSSLRQSDAAEAFGWVASGMLCGIALGNALGGALIESHGTTAAFIASVCCALASLLLPLVTVSKLPDLRISSGPLLDTTAVPVIWHRRPQ